ncbi:regulatory protein [Streptomyces zinciresistens K42]|uniref:Regulatory protein n=1 Tax=Streptomyces zinciresistens K42 TaxID=700597 RepID=G2GHJ2_9ACTN|nr:LuxR C-terminal-related transcriptional regulator [Streptomyces zinciresistens]EGX57020.1 regulatory protein [Streptomyces zinciresistens K42]
MTSDEPAPETLDLPWPFTGRGDELALVRGALSSGRGGIVLTGPAGFGKSRLVTEAVRGTGRVRAAGTPETRHVRLAAFAHLVPENASLHDALRRLSGERLLVVDDAHFLDDASAALVHQLAVHGRTRLLVAATDGHPAPHAVTRLWTGELLPRLALRALPRDETAALLTGAADRPGPEPLTVNRLHRLCGGDLRLLRELAAAARGHGPLPRTGGTGTWAWRGPVPLTPAVREHARDLLGRCGPEARETLERLAHAEPLPPDADTLDLGTLEHLEAHGLVHLDDRGAVRLAHPLHGPALRAVAGRLRATRLSPAPDRRAAALAAALAAERAELSTRITRADVRDAAAPVGEWLADEGRPVPARYAAVRARYARLRGELRDAAAWAREGLRDGDDPACLRELALAAAQSGQHPTAHQDPGGRPHGGGAVTRPAPADGPGTDAYDAVRLGAPERAAGRLGGVFADHADALARGDGPALDHVAERLRRRGFLLFAAEAHAQAVRAHRDPSAARASRARAVALARRCQGARTPALSGLVLGELTARQRQIVTLAATGLSNRQIAERLTLSVRTVGNHLYSAYARLGADDRGALPRLVELPDTRTA